MFLSVLVDFATYKGATKSTGSGDGAGADAGGGEGMSSTNAPMLAARPSSAAGNVISDEDVARGFSVLSIVADEDIDFAMPSNGEMCAAWWVRGGSEDLTRVPGGWAAIGGEIFDAIRSSTNSFYPFRTMMGMWPGHSRFWYAATTNDSMLYTWQDALFRRETAMPVSVQAEIFGNGDFVYRYALAKITSAVLPQATNHAFVGYVPKTSLDEVLADVTVGARFGANSSGAIDIVSAFTDSTRGTVTVSARRMSEFDWDGDGLANEVDPQPRVAGGDCHGQNAGWVLTCCTNGEEIAAAGGYAEWAASLIANDADDEWYVFTVAPSEFDATGHAMVDVDGLSVVLDRENPSASFALMRGRRYPFIVEPSCEAMFSSAAHDGVSPQIEYDFGNGFVWIDPDLSLNPPQVTLRPIPGFSTADIALSRENVHPFLIEDGRWSSSNGWLRIEAQGDTARVSWQGAEIARNVDALYYDVEIAGCVYRKTCMVRFDPDDEILPHVTLRSPNTIFVNDDDDNRNWTNDFQDVGVAFASDDDDIARVVVGFESLACPTNGTLRLVGEGVRRWENRRHEGVCAHEVMITNCVTPFMRSYYIERDSLAYSPVNGVKLSLEWVERDDDVRGVVTNSLTAVEPIVEPITMYRKMDGGLYNPYVIVRNGANASFYVHQKPIDYPRSLIQWECTGGELQFVSTRTGCEVVIRANADSVGGRLFLQYGDCQSDCPTIDFITKDLRVLPIVPIYVVGQDEVITEFAKASLIEDVSRVNQIFEQAGVMFSACDPGVIEMPDDLHINYNDPASILSLLSLTNMTGRIVVYSVPKIIGVDGFCFPSIWKLAFSREVESVEVALAHELGHALGLRDIYYKNSPNQIDWNRVMVSHGTIDIDDHSGAGPQRYYEYGIKQKEIIERCLMCGTPSSASRDIPSGYVVGTTQNFNGGSDGHYCDAWIPVGESALMFRTNSFSNTKEIKWLKH